MDWLGDPTLLPKPQLLPLGSKAHSHRARGTPLMGEVVGTQLPGPIAEPLEQLCENQTDLLCLRFNGSDSFTRGSRETKRWSERTLFRARSGKNFPPVQMLLNIADFWPSSASLGSARAVSPLGCFQTPHVLHRGTIFRYQPYSSMFQVIWTKD